jgi:peptidoglycan/LPS O-acetylase OafA/YrhL
MATPDAKHSFGTLEGLRGILAVFVFVCHTPMLCHSRQADGTDFPYTPIYGNLGTSAVFYFFMMTGFLFWLQIIRKPRAIKAVSFLKARFFRLFPVYFISATLTVATALYFSWPIKVSGSELTGQIAPWYAFRIFGLPDINGLHAEAINGPYWSLRYEWAFYALIPLFALVGRQWWGRASIIVIMTGITLGFGTEKVPGKVLGFVAGMLVAEVAVRPLWQGIRNRYLGWSVILGTIAVLAVAEISYASPIHKAQILYLSPLFFLCAVDNDAFAFLKSKPTRFLGAISYDVYVFHNIVLYWLLEGFPSTDIRVHWLKVLLSIPIILLITVPVHWFVERPFMKGMPSLELIKALFGMKPNKENDRQPA